MGKLEKGGWLDVFKYNFKDWFLYQGFNIVKKDEHMYRNGIIKFIENGGKN